MQERVSEHTFVCKDRPAVTLSQLALTVGLLGALGLTAHRIGVSAIPAYLLSGILLGPNEPRALSLIQPSEVTDFVAELGIIFLLFFLGLEFSLGRLSRTGRHVGLGGLIDLATNAALGLVVMRRSASSSGSRPSGSASARSCSDSRRRGAALSRRRLEPSPRRSHSSPSRSQPRGGWRGRSFASSTGSPASSSCSSRLPCSSEWRRSQRNLDCRRRSERSWQASCSQRRACARRSRSASSAFAISSQRSSSSSLACRSTSVHLGGWAGCSRSPFR